MTNFFLPLLKLLGYRSRCCGAPIQFRWGWNWKTDGDYCTGCDRLIK